MSIDSLGSLAQTYMNMGPTRGGEDQLKKLAQEFESLFLNQLLSIMRQSTGKDGFFEGAAGHDIYSSMMDQALARSLAESGGLGLAKPLYEYLKNKSEMAPGPDPAAPTPLDQKKSDPSEIIAILRRQLQKYRVSSDMGWRKDPITGETRFHKGVDFAAPEGSPVPSAASGKVVFSGHQGGYGKTVVIENSQGQRVRYAHLSRLDVEQGQEVREGQNIGAVGSTGRSTGAHLHVEVEKDGRMYNPLHSRYTRRL
jgi:murein DD-endopeptidase MepM/ murein hydrolase activator NlpD